MGLGWGFCVPARSALRSQNLAPPRAASCKPPLSPSPLGPGMLSSSPPALLLPCNRVLGPAASNLEGSGLWNGGSEEPVQKCGYGFEVSALES